MRRILPTVVFVAVAAPMLAAAQSPDLDYFASLFIQLEQLVADVLIPLVLAFALLMFIWGIIQYFILGAGDEEKRATGRLYMLYSIVGLVAIVAVWGLVNLLLEIIGVSPTGAPPAPDVPR